MSKQFKQIILLSLFSFFAYFIHNGSMQEGIMEIRNFVAAKEIVQESNWMVPTMNGTPRLEKPPLPTWISAALYRVGGDSLSVQRFPAALAATLLTLTFYLLVSILSRNRQIAFLSALVLLSSFYMIFLGRTATWDIYCQMFMLMSIYFLTKGLLYERQNYIDYVLAGVMMGLSYLSKGPVAFQTLLVPFLIAFVVCYKEQMRVNWKGMILAGVLGMIIGLSWTVYLYLNVPELMEQAMTKEIVSWSNRSVKPWWYYWNFFIQTGIWTVFTIVALLYPIWKKVVSCRNSYKLAVIWALIILVSLSVVPKKDPRYLFPILIPIALAIGAVLSIEGIKGWRARLVDYNFYLLAFIAIVISGGMIYLIYDPIIPLPTITLVATSLGLAICAVVIITNTLRARISVATVGVVCIMATIELFLPAKINEVVARPSTNGIQNLVSNEQYANIPLYHLPELGPRIEVVYYANKKILPIDTTEIKLPIILITSESIENYLDQHWLNNYRLREIGIYDDNIQGKKKPTLINHATLVESR